MYEMVIRMIKIKRPAFLYRDELHTGWFSFYSLPLEIWCRLFGIHRRENVGSGSLISEARFVDINRPTISLAD